ncbi:DUF6932 family protein [Pectobacterium versatile]|uniref:DUF6932 family protein n=1 Tax=Pectobacterium versatile TaxID=2488639 RepID=UPI0037F1E51A
MADFNVPLWNEMGVIPPINESQPTGSARSPYETDIIKFVSMFAQTPPRKHILQGFLSFRKALYQVGITDGFQWIDGSFTEHIELIEGRAPNDLDLVTFFNFNDGDDDTTIISRNQYLFNHEHVKSTYHIDSYFEPLGTHPSHLVSRAVYWYSVWSHKRDLSWKGFLQIPLSPSLDDLACTILKAAIVDGGEQ